MPHEQTLEQIQTAIRAHGAWKLRLKTAIGSGTSDISPDDVACDNLCDFGKWLYGDELSAEMRAGVPYSVIKRLHAEFHKTAGLVLKDAVSGKTTEAKARLDGPFQDQSAKLVRALTKWKGELKGE